MSWVWYVQSIRIWQILHLGGSFIVSQLHISTYGMLINTLPSPQKGAGSRTYPSWRGRFSSYSLRSLIFWGNRQENLPLQEGQFLIPVKYWQVKGELNQNLSRRQDCTVLTTMRGSSCLLRLYSLNNQEKTLSVVETVQSQLPRGIPLGHWDYTILTAKGNTSGLLRLYSLNGRDEPLLVFKTVQSWRPEGIPTGEGLALNVEFTVWHQKTALV
jgi:hypothetical protein